MAIIKCKICGGDMELSPDKTFGTCEYCGSVMTLPRVDNEQRAAQFNRGNHFRRQGEFDKALAVYERIVSEDDTDAEAHWCCALCRFGIEYVEDPATYEYLPTCHRASFDSFLEDVDYLAAVEHSDGITRRQYQKDGAKIAEVQRAILATSRKEEPFDVFICYKETDDETKERTRDSLDAQEIYYNLTQEGYRVFFARITLEDKAGTEYEPYIFAALNSAKVMVVVGEKAEYFNAVWVKNEWSRFLALIRGGAKKRLIPAYRDMDPAALPEEFAPFPAMDMSRLSFLADLIQYIRSGAESEEPKTPELKEPKPLQQPVEQPGVGVMMLTAQLKRGQQALEDRDWAAADGFFDKALDMDAECAEAFFGKALAAAECIDGEALVQKRISLARPGRATLIACPRDSARIEAAVRRFAIPEYYSEKEIRDCFRYDARAFYSYRKGWETCISREKDYWERTDRNLIRALGYAKGDTAAVYAALRDSVISALEAKRAASEAEDARVAGEASRRYALEMDKASRMAAEGYEKAQLRRQQDYESCCRSQAAARTSREFTQAAERFRQFGMRDYADSAQRADQCRAMAMRLIPMEKAAETEKARAEAQKRAEAEKLMRRKERGRKESRVLLTIGIAAAVVLIVSGTLLVKRVIRPAAQYRAANALLDRNSYREAAAAFTELGDYRDSAELAAAAYYRLAKALLREDDRTGAAFSFGQAAGYRDAAERSMELWDELVERQTLAAGGRSTIALRTDGTVVVTGWVKEQYPDLEKAIEKWTDIIEVDINNWGVVGLRADGTVVAAGAIHPKTEAYRDPDYSKWTDVVSVSAGDGFLVGLKSNGTLVFSKADNYSSERDTNSILDVLSWNELISIAAGSRPAALRADGTVMGIEDWTDIVAIDTGTDQYLMIGLRADGTVAADGSYKAPPYSGPFISTYELSDAVSKWKRITAVAAGGNHAVGLETYGSVIAAGNNDYGQCDVTGWWNIRAVAAGDNFTLGLRADGTVVAAGDNEYGQCDVSGWRNIKLPD